MPRKSPVFRRTQRISPGRWRRCRYYRCLAPCSTFRVGCHTQPLLGTKVRIAVESGSARRREGKSQQRPRLRTIVSRSDYPTAFSGVLPIRTEGSRGSDCDTIRDAQTAAEKRNLLQLGCKMCTDDSRPAPKPAAGASPPGRIEIGCEFAIGPESRDRRHDAVKEPLQKPAAVIVV